MTTPALQMLNNFYLSVQHDRPVLAEQISPDIEIVALYGIAATTDNTQGKEAADRLRRVAWDLPVIQARVLEGALEALGF